MQAQCPTCSQRIFVDDSRVPDKAFSVRCPKCQTPVRLPGRSVAGPTPAPSPAAAHTDAPAVPPATSAAGTPSAPPVTAPAAAPPSEEIRPEVMAQLRKELREADHHEGKFAVLVALPDRSLAGSLSLPLSRLGYAVETLEDLDEGARLLEEGLYEIVITTRTMALPAKRESLFQRVARLSPEARRRIFLVLVGEEFRTGDGIQAFAATADVVIHPKDVASAEGVLLGTLAERARLYRVFLDARRNLEAGLG